MGVGVGVGVIPVGSGMDEFSITNIRFEIPVGGIFFTLCIYTFFVSHEKGNSLFHEEKEVTVIVYRERVLFTIRGKDIKTFCFLKDHSFFSRTIVNNLREVFRDLLDAVLPFDSDKLSC